MAIKKKRKTTEKKEQVHSNNSSGLFILKIVAFICGASVMGLEMVGVRLLEPFFGSTNYVWGAIIGIFLAALSIGYWFGGRLADRYPSLGVLGYLIVASAVMIFLIPWFLTDVCNGLLSMTSSLKIQVLLASLTIFSLPSIILGMVSPFAVRLATKSVSGVGRVAGSLYAISTIGSIIGTLLVSFVLVELVGNRMIVWGIGIILILVALVCFLNSKKIMGVMAVIGLIFALTGHYGIGYAESKYIKMCFIRYKDIADGLAFDGGMADSVIDMVESVYHDIIIIESRFIYERPDGIANGCKARYMKLGRVVQGGIVQGGVIIDDDGRFTSNPPQVATRFPLKFHASILFNGKIPKRVLVIGCGCGIAPLSFAHDYSDTIERIDVVDIDPYVFQMARKHFGYDDSGPIINSHVMDGRMFIQQSKEKWDFVILDAFNSVGRKPRHLLTKEFYSCLRDHLSENGVIAINIMGSPDGENGHFFRSIYRTVDTVFNNTYAFSSQNNIFIFATTDEKRLTHDEINNQLEKLIGNTIKQSRDYIEAVVDNMLPEPSSYNDYVILTDDFCPVD